MTILRPCIGACKTRTYARQPADGDRTIPGSETIAASSQNPRETKYYTHLLRTEVTELREQVHHKYLRFLKPVFAKTARICVLVNSTLSLFLQKL